MAVRATRSAAQLSRVMADLQCTNELLLEKNGSLEARSAIAGFRFISFIGACFVWLT